MKLDVVIGQTDKTVLVFIPDPASTDGSGKTGLAAADLTVSYTRVEADNDVVVTDATGSLSNIALTDVHTDWGVEEVSSTLAPGLYRLDLADAVFASGATEAVVYVMITTSAASASPMEFALYTDLLGDPSVGLAAIKAAVAVNEGYLIDFEGAGTAVKAGSITTASFAAGAITAAAIAADAIGASELAADAATEIATAVAANASIAAALTRVGLALPAAAPDAAGGLPISDGGGLDMDGQFNVVVATYGVVDTEMAAALAAVDTEVAAIKAKTDSLTFTTANLLDVRLNNVAGITLDPSNGTGNQGVGGA